MTIRNIHSGNSISQLSEQINAIENNLNTNLLDEIQRIALIPSLEDIFLEIKVQTKRLETRVAMFKEDASIKEYELAQENLLSIAKVKAVWERIYHNCLRAQLSSFAQICNRAELAYISNPQTSLKTSREHVALKKIQLELRQLTSNIHLVEEERRSIKDFLLQIEKLLSLFEIQIEEDLAADPKEKTESSLDIGMFTPCPNETILHLLSFLSGEDLAQLARCNRFFRDLCENDSFWENILGQEFPSLCIPANQSAKETYITQKAMINSLKKGLYTCSTLIKEEAFIHCAEKSENLIFLGLNNFAIKVWDLKDPTAIECIATLSDHGNSINCLHKQGNLLFSGSDDYTIKVWDLSYLTYIPCIATLRDHQNSILSLCTEGNLLFSVSYDKTIKIWDLTSLSNIHCIASWIGHMLSICCLQKKDSFLFTGSADAKIKVWDLQDLNLNNISCFASLEEHLFRIRCLHIKGDLLFSASNANIKIWDLKDLNKISCIANLIEHQLAVDYLYSEGNLLFSGSIDHTIKVWDLRDLNNIHCISTLKGHLKGVCHITKQGNCLFSASFDGTIKVWDLNVSSEDTLLNLLDMFKDPPKNYLETELNQEKMKIFVSRIHNLSPLIRNQIYEEFYKIHRIENRELAEHAFLDVKEFDTNDEKKIQAVFRYLLKQVITLFKNGRSQEAKDLFNKLPQEIKNAIYDEFNNKDDDSYIEVIEKFLSKKSFDFKKL